VIGRLGEGGKRRRGEEETGRQGEIELKCKT
jgi:hypothetical protein